MRHRHPRLRRLLLCALPAAAVVGLIWVADGALAPAHARGAAQAPLGLLIALSRLLEVPGEFLQWKVVDRFPYGRRVTVYPYETFLVLSFVFYAAAAAVLLAINDRLNRWATGGERLVPVDTQAMPPAAPPAGQRLTRRRVLAGAKSAVIGAAAAAGGYPLWVEPRRLSVTRLPFPVRDLPPGLEGLRVVQLTDIHLGPWNSVGYVRDVVDAANALGPDLIALTGDYVLRSPKYVEPVASALAGLWAKVGVVGVLGNHDWREDGPLTQRELARAGVRLVDNGRLFITPSRRLTEASDEGLCVAGVGDLWTDRQDYGRALGGLPPAMPRLLLSHNPDVAEERAFVSSGHRVDLMLSGHTHGGQIFLPGVGAMVTMSRYGQKYARGLVRGPTCPVYVSRGLGMAMLPVRFGSVPEIVVIELRRA